MINVTISICCLVFLTIISCFYFFREKLENIDNKIFSNLLIINIVGILIDIFGYISFNSLGSTNIFNILIAKIYLIYFVSYSFCLMIYICNLAFDITKNLKKMMLIFSFLCLVSFVLPIDIYFENNVAYTQGISVIFSYFVGFLIIAIMLFCLIKSLKKIKKKKSIPLFAFVLLTILTVLVQLINPQLTLLLLTDSIVTTLMYFTIENPDVRMIEELQLAREEADKANQAKTDFLSSMSHEIRTPLNAIVGFSQNLYEEDIPSTAKEQVQDIITASNNLLELVNGILDISKIEANKLEIINDEYSFKKVFNELVSLAHARLGDKSLIFKVHYDESIPKVLYGDKLRVKQVILNILTNSIKYTKKGFIEFKVNSIIKDDVCRLIVSVEDSGVGIKKENIDKLFTKFQRFEDRNTTIEGTGLGLAITKKLVELMNGQIIVQSVYGQGSKFTIALDQRIINNPTIDVEEKNSLSLDSETFDLSGKRVLVVDDNKLNLKVASKLLEKYNLTLDLISSGYECLDKIRAGEKFDLILLDDMMPKMSGVETLFELKKIEGFNIPTVILTANAIAGMREKYLNDGFDDYLAKPIEKAELNKVLKEFLMKEE